MKFILLVGACASNQGYCEDSPAVMNENARPVTKLLMASCASFTPTPSSADTYVQRISKIQFMILKGLDVTCTLGPRSIHKRKEQATQATTR